MCSAIPLHFKGGWGCVTHTLLYFLHCHRHCQCHCHQHHYHHHHHHHHHHHNHSLFEEKYFNLKFSLQSTQFLSLTLKKEALCMRWTYTPVVGSTPVLGFLAWSCGHPFRGSVTVQINRQEQTFPSLAKGWALPQAMNGMFCNHDHACCWL